MRTDRRPGPSTRVRVVEIDAGQVRAREDRLATEEPMETRLEWPGHAADRFVVTMRTPGHDFELAAGFTFAEGLWFGDDLASVAYCTDTQLSPEQRYNVVTVSLRRPPQRAPARRQVSMTAACGVCGKESLDEVADIGATPLTPGRTYDHALISSLPDRLGDSQRVFDRTGGLHAAGAFNAHGNALVVREDVGRHNAVDKVVGHARLNNLDLSASVLCVSGRVGFEIVQKAAMAGIGLVAAVGAPSSLAVDLADRFGITVAGFVRGTRMVVYSHPDGVSGAVVGGSN